MTEAKSKYLILHEVHQYNENGYIQMEDNKGNVEPPTFSQRKQRRQEWWKKRHQSKENDASNEQPKKKRRKLKETEKNDEAILEETKTKPASSRFILFIGNLSFDCTEDDIRNHFDFDGGVSDVRILTNKTTGKSKGCAFLEFSSKKIQAKALQLHQSTLRGRRINVEVTCGGGGKGEQRMTKLKSKIDRMKEKRKKAKLKKKQMRQDSATNDKQNL